MKKTIATLAILASTTQAMALIGPGDEFKNVCLKTFSLDDKSSVAANCDETKNNEQLKLEIKENGCAKGQIALAVLVETPIFSCLPPGAVQL